jgi:putative nucleotidyltransferase with HDIG domain
MLKWYDLNTYLHCRRVARIAEIIGRCIGLNSRELLNLADAALLHDLGKIRIPVVILNKPGKLTQSEREIIEEHPRWGAEIIRNDHQDKLSHVVEGIKFHHEHYNGQGYPAKLVGESIPLSGRIISIADAFDAMTSYRPYRSLITVYEARRQIIDAMGSQFDPV